MSEDIQLPKTLHELLKASVEHIIKFEDDPAYEIDMTTWHSPKSEYEQSACHICIAGGFMAGHMQVPPNEAVVPECFDTKTYDALMAIDSMRMGRMSGAYTFLYRKWPRNECHVKVILSTAQTIRSNIDTLIHRAPWEVYLRAAETLRAAGI